MFLPGWSIWCVLLTLRMSACSLEISGYDSHEVIGSQGLSDCTIKDKIPLIVAENNAVGVQNLTSYFKMCCRDGAPCTLCLVIDMEINIHPDQKMGDKGHSEQDEEDYSEDTEKSPEGMPQVFLPSSQLSVTSKLKVKQEKQLAETFNLLAIGITERCSKRDWEHFYCLHMALNMAQLNWRLIAISATSTNSENNSNTADRRRVTSLCSASVTVCYSPASVIPMCKKVECTVNHTALPQKNKAKFYVVINKPAGISFSSQVIVYSPKLPHLIRRVDALSLDDACSPELQERIEECRVPRFSTAINLEMNRVELQFAGNKSLPSVCVQYERNGSCQKWNRTPIPLYAVTPCMCLQVWNEDQQRRSQRCPFSNTNFLQRNVWQNISVSVSQGQMNNHGTMLSWNVTAPCRLEGEVWPCYKDITCREMKGFRQQLAGGTWRQNQGQWEKTGMFEEINLELSPCVMVKVNGMGDELGPFCFRNTDRWRWSLLVVAVMLLVCLTVLLFYLLHDFIKKWAWSWRHGGFVKIGRKGHMVVLSPPDVDDSVSESVCRLGSQLHNQDFSVSVDQWSRKKQCTLGPLPWLHSQLLELNSLGGRVVLVLTRKALERAEEWTRRNKEVIKTKGEDEGFPQICSPYSDVFTASLCLIQADKQQGRAGERFVLVTFDSHLRGDRNLPELLQGLPLFQLPSQTQALMSELTVGRTARGSGTRTWTGWKWSSSEGWRQKIKEGPDQQKAGRLGDKAFEGPINYC